MHLTLQICCDNDRWFDTVRVIKHGRKTYETVYERTVHMGESHFIALNKAVLELEVLAVREGWLESIDLA